LRIEPGSLILPGVIEIQQVHAATIRRHGGLCTSPDHRKIEQALAEVLVFHSYTPDADIALLAAVVAYSFAKGHPLPDGNKRVALFSIRMVLRANGFRWKPRHDEANPQMWALAESPSDVMNRVRHDLAAWIRRDCTLLP
jgi:death-on-curing family protein